MGAPVANMSAPAITGTPTVGQTLTVVPSTWTGFPTPVITRQWFWHDTSAPIAGATGLSYVLVAGDAGHTIRCDSTATNIFGSAVSASTPTAAVGA